MNTHEKLQLIESLSRLVEPLAEYGNLDGADKVLAEIMKLTESLDKTATEDSVNILILNKTRSTIKGIIERLNSL